MPIFFSKKSCNRGGGGTPPQMPLTVKTQGEKIEGGNPNFYLQAGGN